MYGEGGGRGCAMKEPTKSPYLIVVWFINQNQTKDNVFLSQSDMYPTTPRTRIYRSPLSTPSLSSSTPFDWDALRSGKPPPYPSPKRPKPRKSVVAGSKTPKRVVRQKGVVERFVTVH